MSDNKLLQKGQAHLSKGEWTEAKEVLEIASNSEATAEVCEALAKACWWLNDNQALFTYRAQAYQKFLDDGNVLAAARNAAWLGVDYLERKGDFAIANGWIQRGASLLESAAESWELCLIKILKARFAFLTDEDNSRAFQLIDEGLQISRNLGFVDGTMIASGLKGFILITEGLINEGMALLDEATLLATTSEATDVHLSTITCCFLIDACERVRDYERAGQWCQRVMEISTKWQYDTMFASCKNQYASVLIWKGQWENAEGELKEAARVMQANQPNRLSASTVRLGDLRRRQGKWEEAAALFEAAGAHTLKLLYCAALAYDQGEYDSAADLVERYLRKIPAKEKTGKIAGLELQTRIYAKQKRLKESRSVLTELADAVHVVNTTPLKAALHVSEGVLCQAEGNLDLARQHFEDAVDLFDEIEAPFESAAARGHLAEVLITGNQYARAEHELEKALANFTVLGAEKEVARIRTTIKNLHKANVPINAFEFTGREVEVLRLLAEGKNNEEIADQLFLSVRTVEKHLTNLYSKMGISGKSARTFAASYAVRHNLVLN